MKIKKRRFLTGALAFACAITLFAPRLMAASEIDPDADRILRAACKYLADAKGFCDKVEVWKDVVLPTGLKIQTTRALEVQEQRPTSFTSRRALRATATGSGIRTRPSRRWIGA